MNPRLLACPGCSRHVRVSESACPFCASALPQSFAEGPAPRKPTARLSRAALYAFGATSLTLATVACGSSTGESSDSGADQMSATDGPGTGDAADSHMTFDAAYGCPADVCGRPGDSGQETSSGDDGGLDVVAAYGGPGDAFPEDVFTPPGDASSDDGFSPPGDAGADDAETGAIAAYGLPPMP